MISEIRIDQCQIPTFTHVPQHPISSKTNNHFNHITYAIKL